MKVQTLIGATHNKYINLAWYFWQVFKKENSNSHFQVRDYTSWGWEKMSEIRQYAKKSVTDK